MHSSVPSVAAVYATLRRQSARFRCRSPASSPSTLHVSWARTSPCTEPRFQEPARSCFLLAFYTKLSQASTQVWLSAPRSEQGETLWGFKDNRASAARPHLLKTNTMKTLQSTPPTPVASCPSHLDSPVYYWSRPSVFHCFF